MTQPIAIFPTTPVRNTETASRVFETDTMAPTQYWASDEGLSFEDVLKSLNPMHHIPVVSTIYQAASGDRIGIGPRMIGALLLGGPAGLIIAGISAFIEEMSGGTVADHAVALVEALTGDDEAAPADVLAAVPSAAEQGAAAIDASALADAPVIQSQITQTRNAEDWSGEKLAAIAPVVLGAMSPAVLKPDVDSFKSIGFQTQNSESKRISESLLHAQRAQANLLLANLRANDTVKSRPSVDRDRRDGEERAPHSNVRPAGADPIWYADAMQRALDKYRTAAANPAGAP